MKTRLRARVIIGAAIVVSMLMLVGAYSVYAANTEVAQKYPPIVEKLITAFNLDRNEVDKVLAEYQQERKAEHKTRLEDKLDQQIKEGKITAKQKEAILKKMDEMQIWHEELKNLSPAERREALMKQRAELESWAKENGINLKQFMFGFGKHGRGMKGFGPGFGGPMNGPRGFGSGHFGPPLGESALPAAADPGSPTEL